MKINENIGIIKLIAEMMMNANADEEFTLSKGSVNKLGFLLFEAQKEILENIPD